MPNIDFKNAEISYISEVKFLGISISNNLKWNTHVQFLRSKFKEISYMITSLGGDVSLFTLRNLYFTNFQCLIRYGIILWGGEIDSVRVLKIQKRVLLAIKGLNKGKSCRPIFKELNVLTVTALYIFEVIYIKKKKTFIYEGIRPCTNTTQEENVISMFQAVNTSLFNRSVTNMGIRTYKIPTKTK